MNNLAKAALLLLLPFFCHAEILTGKVIRVLDGDTIELLQDNQPVRVRLVNIDAPEKKQAFGRWSGEQLKRAVAARTVTVTYSDHDRYGRILGLVTSEGHNINLWMVSVGAAWVYSRYNSDSTLPALQREAQEKRVGLWADNQPVPPWEWRHKK